MFAPRSEELDHNMTILLDKLAELLADDLLDHSCVPIVVNLKEDVSALRCWEGKEEAGVCGRSQWRLGKKTQGYSASGGKTAHDRLRRKNDTERRDTKME